MAKAGDDGAEGLTQGSGHSQEGDLVDDGAAAHGAVVAQPGPLPHHTVHTRLIDHTESTESTEVSNRNGEVGGKEAKPVKYANVEVIITDWGKLLSTMKYFETRDSTLIVPYKAKGKSET